MASTSIVLRADDITPSLAALSDPELMRRAALAAGTVIGSLAQRAFSEPGLRPTPWPARTSGGSHPLLLLSGNLRQSIHVQPEGVDSVRIGSPVVYGATHQHGRGPIPARPFIPAIDDQLTGLASSAVADAVSALIGAVT